MGYSKEVYEEAMQTLEKRRAAAVARATALRERMHKACPRVAEIEAEMSASSMQVVHAILSREDGDVAQKVETIKARNLALQAELARLLAANGETAVNFEPVYTCLTCRDTGYTDRHMCHCLQSLLREGACRRLTRLGNMPFTRFEDMRLDYYPDQPDESGESPREVMEYVISYCRNYAADFSPHSSSLLLRGPTGTGKTHLSLAITREAAARGYHAVYGPTQVLLHQIEKEHFGRAEGNSEDMMTECDLLVLDDLGAEFPSQFYTSCLYNLVNTRMLTGLPTIVSTNLNHQQLLDRYGDQITSRIVGTFTTLLFAGRDIRLINQRNSVSKER